MTKKTKYVAGPDVPAGETLRDSQGRVIDQGYVDRAVEDAIWAQLVRPQHSSRRWEV